MSMRSIHVTIEEVIDAGITLNHGARRTAKIARELGFRFDNNEFHKLYAERKKAREGKAA